MQQAWALLGKLFWLTLVATGVALLWKVAWGSVSGGAPQQTLAERRWMWDPDSEPWMVPPPM